MLDHKYWKEFCTHIFGEHVHTRRAYNYNRISKSNKGGKVLYVNSIEDPWLSVSVLPKNIPS